VQRWSPDLLAAYLAGVHREGVELVGSSAEARGAAFRGLAVARQSDTWPRIRAARIPTLLLLATLQPHVEVNERLVTAFMKALPEADVRWVPNAGHGLLADAGPALGDEIGAWLASRAAPAAPGREPPPGSGAKLSPTRARERKPLLRP
jgi:pimeloyl-ACP methyl ester carboxylesterase